MGFLIYPTNTDIQVYFTLMQWIWDSWYTLHRHTGLPHCNAVAVGFHIHFTNTDIQVYPIAVHWMWDS